MSDPARELLRHTLATVAYRGAKVIRGAPDDFGTFKPGEGTRTPGEILAHICDLLDWASSLARGAETWKDSTPGGWRANAIRFHDGLARLDGLLAAPGPIACAPERLFQGPIADALTHIGQLALLRRRAGAPVKGENYFKADIVAGRVGPEQTEPKREFD